MIKEGINRVLELASPNFHADEKGRTFSDKIFKEIKPDMIRMPSDMSVSSLEAVVDYIKNNLDDEAKYCIHVSSYDRVDVYGEYIPEFCVRKNYITALPGVRSFPFNEYMDSEVFNVKIQAFFNHSESREKLLAIVGNVADETGITTRDDGVTQQVEVKTGIVRKAEVELPNPVELLHFDTFPEIEVAPRKFVFRMRKGGNGPMYALFDTGDTLWQREYVGKIKKYLNSALCPADPALADSLFVQRVVVIG